MKKSLDKKSLRKPEEGREWEKNKNKNLIFLTKMQKQDTAKNARPVTKATAGHF